MSFGENEKIILAKNRVIQRKQDVHGGEVSAHVPYLALVVHLQ